MSRPLVRWTIAATSASRSASHAGRSARGDALGGRGRRRRARLLGRRRGVVATACEEGGEDERYEVTAGHARRQGS